MLFAMGRIVHAWALGVTLASGACVSAEPIAPLPRAAARPTPTDAPPPHPPTAQELAHDAEASLRRADGARAIELATRAIELEPDYEWAWHVRGAARRLREEYDAALADLDHALELDAGRTDWGAYCDRAEVRSWRQEFDRAEQDVARAMVIAPEQGDVWHCRARIRVAKGDLDGAIADADHALLLGGAPDPTTWRVLGRAHQKKGEFPLALAAYDQAVKESPDAWTLARRSQVRLQLGNMTGATEDAVRAFELAPRDPLVLAQNGAVRAASGDLEGAIDEATVATLIDPRYSDPWRVRGLARAARGDTAGARDDLGRYLERTQDPFDAREIRAKLAALPDEGSPR
jgi:tetratricopeptide (TPR) repeat protein